MKGLHIVRYGTPADQKYLLGKFKNSYDQLVINAVMVAHMPGALATLLSSRISGKPFFIDPQTHAFQHDPEYLLSNSKKKEKTIKRSISKLIEYYGYPTTYITDNKPRSVLPGDLADKAKRKRFCKRVLEFQKERLNKELQSSDSEKYYGFLKDKGKIENTQLKPSFYIAPYFYLSGDENNLGWLKINVDMVKDCRALLNKKTLAAEIVISKKVLSNGALINNIVERYSEEPPDLYLIWIDSFSENEASEDELKSFINLLQKLGKTTPIINLYGGYFSIILAKARKVKKLVGIAHGLEYGEDRGVVPVGGGIPTAKYYYPELHTRLLFREALRALNITGGTKSVAEYQKNVCDCEECKLIITDDPKKDFYKYGMTKTVSFMRRGEEIVSDYPLPETKDHSVRHYMWRKLAEYKDEMNITEVLSALKKAERLGSALSGHCSVWHSVLHSIREEEV